LPSFQLHCFSQNPKTPQIIVQNYCVMNLIEPIIIGILMAHRFTYPLLRCQLNYFHKTRKFLIIRCLEAVDHQTSKSNECFLLGLTSTCYEFSYNIFSTLFILFKLIWIKNHQMILKVFHYYFKRKNLPIQGTHLTN